MSRSHRSATHWLLFVILIAVVSPHAAQAQDRGPSTARPNFVVILIDDLGYGDVGYHGARDKTPHIDQLAKTGVRLERHYVNPLCSPTRAALMTGRYASRFGCTAPQAEQVLPFNTVTIASALASVGYDTGQFGKWHLGSKPDWGPQHFGFKTSYGSLGGGVGPYDHHYKVGPYTNTWQRNGTLIEEPGHVTDLITREAVQFIERPRSGPFLAYVPFTAVHIPLDEPQEWIDAQRHVESAADKLRAACLAHLDDSVGKILAALDRTKQRDNTLVLFLSDNGAHDRLRNDDPKYPGEYPSLQVGGSNAPWRGFKGGLYEGGIRTPAIAHWSGKLKAGEVHAPLHVSDWMPTLCKLAGYTPSGDLKWDGQDIWSLVSGQNTQPSMRTIYCLGPGRNTQVLLHGDWKLITPRKGTAALYNLARDPGEQHDVSAQQSEVLADLLARLNAAAARDDDARVEQTRN